MTVDSDLIELIRLNPGITVGEIEHTDRFRHLAMGKRLHDLTERGILRRELRITRFPDRWGRRRRCQYHYEVVE